MGGVCMIGGRRNRRQTAVRLFAQEYNESSLPDGGQGEFDPRFIVTKLGARVNRMMIAGVIERMERRETEKGPMYSGRVRDSTGMHSWSVGSFKPELHTELEELLARFEGGDRVLMACIGKSSHFATEDGGIFCRMQMEDFAVIDRDTYAQWLVETSDHTMRRIDALYKAQTAEDSSAESLRNAGVPEDLIDGLGLAINHYGEWDPEGYKVGVLQALSAAEGRVVNFEEHEAMSTSDSTPEKSQTSEPDSDGEMKQETMNTAEIEDIVLEIIKQNAGERGIDHDSIVKKCAVQGITDESSIEDAIDCLRDDKCEIMEPNFGWFLPM